MSQSLKKHPGGRPTKYNRAILDQTMDYLENYETFGDVVPQIAGLAQVIGTTRETIHAWLNDETKKEFSHMVSKVMSAQERTLVNGGLGNKYNSGITKLILSKHGYSDSDNKQGVSVNVIINDKPVEVVVNDKTLEIEGD